MRTANVFMSALHLLIIFLIFGIGSFFVTLYFYPNILLYFINLLISQPQLILKVGAFSLLLALTLVIVFYMINKKQYLKFIMEKHQIHIDSNLIRALVEKYLETSYPDTKNKLEICILPKDKLEIIATVDSLDVQKDLLSELEKKIGKLLSKHLNYEKDFVFTLKSRK